MTEFGKATKELAALEMEVAAMAERLQAVLEASEEADVRALLASVQKVAAHTDASGALGAKAAKFKAKAQAPADTRLYSDAMVAKVMTFVEGLEDTRAKCLVLEEPLAAWVRRFDAAAAEVAALAAELQRCEASEEATRGGGAALEEEAERVLLAEVVGPSGAAWAELCAAAREESFKIVRRIENREKSRAKKLRAQAELREAAALRKAREEGERRAGFEDAFAQLLGRMGTKETRERRGVLDTESDAFTTLLTSFARRTGGGGGGAVADPTALRRRRSSPAAGGGRGGGGAASSRGTTPPRAVPTEAPASGRRSPTARQGRGGAAGAAAGPPQKVFQEASICQLPPAVLDMTFDVTAVSGTASVELCSRDGRITVAVYKALLRLREGHGGYGCDEAFTMPVELLTDRKAKKRYLKGESAAGKPAMLDGAAVADDDEDEDDDAELLADESGEGEGDGEDEEVEWVNPYAEEEEVNVDVLPQSCAISFFRPLTEGCVVVMMSVGGSFAGGIFVGGDCLVHTTFSRYVVRGKQGGRQSNHEGRTDTVGSQMRRAHEIRYKELIAQQLHAWRVPLHHATAIVLHAPSPVNRGTFFNPPVFPAISGNNGGPHPIKLAKKDPRILPVPFTTHKPSFTEVKRIHESLLSCRYSHQSS